MTDSKENNADYNYITRIIQHLDNRHGVIFFISPRDFDVLYRWWEKRIPLRLIEKSIANVVTRRERKRQLVTSFSNFYYEVKKNFKAFLELNVGAENKKEEKGKEFDEIDRFLENFPEALIELKEDFEQICRKVKAKEDFDLIPLHRKLLELFRDNRELELKVEIFLKNLAPRLRNAQIAGKYRLNYLLNKFHIPGFEIYRE
ncbi:MAG: hypothetical protein KAW12_24020 [Candidatus Aminicenantes bacterium]|nr:hypothetical protein [Candidatus Aminicenantes bacterium]